MRLRHRELILKAGMALCMGVAAGSSFVLCAQLAPIAKAEPGEYGPCAPCKAEYVDQTNFGAPDGECEHGFAWDADCYTIIGGQKVQTKACCETEWGGTGCTGAANECACTTCTPANGCESMQKRWTVWCGRSGSGTCFGLPAVAGTTTGPLYITQKRKPAVAATGCNALNAGAPWKSEPCGGVNMAGGASTSIGLACKATAGDCVNDGAPVNSANVTLNKCGP